MDRQLTRPAPASVAVAEPAPPRVSQSLALWISDAINGHHLNPLPAGVRQEARRALATLDVLCAPVGAEAAYRWLKPLAAGFTIPLTENDFKVRASAIVPTLADLPGVLFTPAMQRAAMLEWSYFPGVKDLHDFLARRCRDWQRDQKALERITALPEPPPPPEMTQEERDAILARFRAQMAQVAPLAAVGGDQAVPAGRPLPLRDDVLLANYEAVAKAPGPGQVAAQFRAEALRRKIAARTGMHSGAEQ